MYSYKYVSPLGLILIASDGDALTGLWFEGEKRYGSLLSPDNREQYLPVFGDAMRWLDIYFSGREPDFTPPIKFSGTEFRLVVWEILQTIPYGETVTYGEIAALIARRKGLARMSAQAVGGAVGHNPVSVIVPCHRVVGADGGMTGYAGGIDRKIKLIALEKSGRTKV